MPSLTFENLKTILDLCSEKKDNYTTFVETGTHRGDTIIPMSEHFDKLYTIELSENLFNEFKFKKYNVDKIESILGDSSKVFPDILPKITHDTIFFLDGHFSHQGTAQGDKDVPLIEEITAINNFFKKSGIIIIDDLRLFGTTNYEDWGNITIESVTNPIKNKIINTFSYEDRFIIHFK